VEFSAPGRHDCGALAFVQSHFCRTAAGKVRVGPDFEPVRNASCPHFHRLWCGWISQLAMNCRRNENPFKQRGQEVDFVDQQQVVERPCIGDDQPHALSKSEPLQIASLPPQIVQAVRLEYAVALQEAVQLIAGRKAE
jgi:hypothetical protein